MKCTKHDDDDEGSMKKLKKSKQLFECNNKLHISGDAEPCVMVAKQFDVCEVCKDYVFGQTYTRTSHDANPHLPEMFKEVSNRFGQGEAKAINLLTGKPL